MSNPFLTHNEPVYAEKINAALAFYCGGQILIQMSLPEDYNDGNFLSGLNKVVMMTVELFLNDTEINSNKIRLVTGKTTGTATFRIYPNIEPLQNWKSIRWTKTSTTGTVTCNIKKDSGVTTVHNNINNPEDLRNEGLILEPVDFIFTLTEVTSNRPTLDTISLELLGGI